MRQHKRTNLLETYLPVGTFRNELFYVTGPSIHFYYRTRRIEAIALMFKCQSSTDGATSFICQDSLSGLSKNVIKIRNEPPFGLKFLSSLDFRTLAWTRFLVKSPDDGDSEVRTRTLYCRRTCLPASLISTCTRESRDWQEGRKASRMDGWMDGWSWQIGPENERVAEYKSHPP